MIGVGHLMYHLGLLFGGTLSFSLVGGARV